MSALELATGIVVALGMLAVVTAGSRWWRRRPTQARLGVALVAGLGTATTLWMVAAGVGAELPDVVNLGLGLLLLALTVGSVLQARRRLDQRRAV